MLNKLNQIIKEEIKENVELAPYTSFKIGGAAKFFYTTDNEKEISDIVKLCRKNNFPYFVLGGGSNVLVNDDGFDGLIIKWTDNKIKIKDDIVECGAGVLLSKLIGITVGTSLTGLEWGVGIPGTVGGAIHNNCGAYGGEMADNIEEVTVLRNGSVRKLKLKDCQFSYRDSIFKTEDNNDIILSAILKLKRGDSEKSRQQMKEILNKRNEKKLDKPSVGSIFRNVALNDEMVSELTEKGIKLPEDFVKWQKIPAAWLVEQCELKGKVVGGAKVFENHAGIIINEDKATANDVVMLISIIKQKVRSKFGIQLQEEVEYVGF